MDYLCNLSNLNGISLSIEPIFLLINSMNNNYNCSDVLVRLLAIDCYYGKNDYGFKIYNEMQKKRVLNNPNVPNERAYNQRRFEELIKSFEENGFKQEYPIQVNKELEFLDGSHRLALSLYHHIESIPVYFSKSRLDRKIDYSLEWFKKEGLCKYEDIILKKYEGLLNEYKEELLLIVIGNIKETVDYQKILSKDDKLILKSSFELDSSKFEILNKKYNFFKNIGINKKIIAFKIKVNYKIRNIKFSEDKKMVLYDEFDLCSIPYIVLSKNENEIIKEILNIGVNCYE